MKKIAILQLNFLVGDVAGNAKKIIRAYHQAVKKGAELVVATELALLGYPPKDLLFHDEYLEEQNKFLEEIMKEVGSVGLILGVATRNLGKGKSLRNSGVLIRHGKIVTTQHKTLLPTYDVFDEGRYFAANDEDPVVFPYDGKKMAILICEDIWGETESGNGSRLYADDPVEKLAGIGIDILISVNASPYYWGKGNVRYDLIRRVATKIKTSVIYANQVGGNDELVFDGRSFVLDARGRCIGRARAFEEDVIIIDTEGQDEETYPFDEGNVSELLDALVLGTRDYVRKTGFQKAVIGLSGGIDSALVAYIAAQALGKENVLGVGMPSAYSSRGSVDDARILASNLEIEFKLLPIVDSIEAVRRTMTKAEVCFGGLAEENIQARIRGNCLMFLSNTLGHIVLTTGNKSETSVGYCTLYGDTAGGFAVISDVYKTTVYDLARFINRQEEIIPWSIIEKAPSAELRPDQKDTDSLPPYEVLDSILRLYVEEKRNISEIIKGGYDPETVERVVKLVNRNEYKRKQLAPGIKVTSLAFGSGRRFPIAYKS